MRVHFCGLARDCSDTLSSNLDNIIRIGEDKRISSYEIWIAENDSNDSTKEVLRSYDTEENINLYNYDGLDKKIENRVKRISYLRDNLLNKIKKYEKNKKGDVIYCPIDLDSEIASSVDLNTFISESKKVLGRSINAVFPTSEPYYYDIYALRKRGWVENNCWGVIGGERTNIGSFWSKYKNIYSKQLPAEKTVGEGRIKVESAFGGLGIYVFSSVSETSYGEQAGRKDTGEKGIVCEHVGFNRQIDRKEISNELIVKAPDEHLRFKLKSRYEKIGFIYRLLVADIKKIIKKILEITKVRALINKYTGADI
jgi:hypothetical protein